MMKTNFLMLLILFLSPIFSYAQIVSGGSFSIEKSAVASGGATSSGGVFTLTGTNGQNSAGTNSANSVFNHQSGFWTPETFAPTSAAVTVSGKVRTADERGIRNAVITLTDSSGTRRTALTGSFGHFRFTNVLVGETYILTVSSKSFVFLNPMRIITVEDEITNADFTAEK